MIDKPISVVALGGTSKPGSSTEKALRVAVRAAQAAGASVTLFDGAALTALPHYGASPVGGCREAVDLVEALRTAEGVLIASPGWHGTVSGLVKNAVDYLEETARDSRPYLDGLPVGLIATAYGWQAAVATLATLRAMSHALRGWPTPLGAAVNCSGRIFQDEACTDEAARRQLETVGRQVVSFAALQRRAAALEA
ncbi:MAG TPA: NAD(P)H-dependent oxidoreductase [Caulobacteraceae bacterium]|nr:NAD(P)H-dependent oxidoreductase [Caulobacteraceae bacterium]